MNSQDDRRELRDVVANFLTRTQDFAAVRRAMTEGYDRETWRRLAGELGLTGVGLDETAGGSGRSLADFVVVTEELGRHLDPSPFVPSIVFGARLLAASVAEPDWLSAVVAGDTVVTVGLDHANWCGVAAVSGKKVDDAVHVFGQVRNVMHGAAAEHVLVMVDLEDGPTLVAVRTDDAGVRVEPVETVDLTRPLVDVSLDRAVAVVLVRPGDFEKVLSSVLTEGRIAMAAELVGVAQGVLDLTVNFAQQRSQFGRAIGSYQSIKHALVDVMMDVEATRTAVTRAAEAFDSGNVEATSLSLLCQAVASDVALAAGKLAIQIHGAIGFTWEHDAHLFLKRAMAGHLMLGSARHHRELLADTILDQTS